jgi:hypothetical protein
MKTQTIAEHLASYDRKIEKRRKAREAAARRKKNRGLAAFIERLKQQP